MNMKTVKQS